MSAPRDRFYDIDGLRFFAALVVVFYHYTFRGYAADDLSPIPFELLGTVTRYGYLGVDLFFMISGFVILMSAGHGVWSKFAISRFVRIYPTLWLAIILTGAVMYLYGQAPFEVDFQTWALNFLLVGSYVGVPYLDGVYWSLLVELKFYFLIFIALIFGWISQINRLLLGWLLISFVLTFSPVHIPYIGFFFFPEWSHYFIAGSVCYLIRREGLDITKIGLLIGSFGLSLYYGDLKLTELEAKFGTEFSQSFVFGSIAVFYAVFTLIGLNKTKWVNAPWLLHLGVLTYPLYLIHQNIGFIGFYVFEDYLSPTLLLILMTALMLIASYFIAELAAKKVDPFFKRLSEAAFKKIGLL